MTSLALTSRLGEDGFRLVEIPLAIKAAGIGQKRGVAWLWRFPQDFFVRVVNEDY